MAADCASDHFRRVLVTDVELTAAPREPRDARGYTAVRALIRLRGIPIGEVNLPLAGVIDDGAIRSAAIDRLSWPILRQLVRTAIGRAGDRPRTAEALFDVRPGPTDQATPTVTVAICTRDRAGDLARCLDAVQALDPPPDQVVVVDNAPSSNDTRLLVIQRRGVRYVREPRPGLDWARNRAICESTSDIVAFTDDDVVVDPLWVGALKRTFADFPEAMAVTGLVLPYELETAAQLQFEEYGGFGRGFERRVFRVDQAHGERAVAEHGGTGKFGTGANMAFRKSVFAEIGHFDPALDVGTVTNGGGDLDMFFRVLRGGHTLVYEPAALVRHRHRRDRRQLVRQIENNGIGFYSYLVRNALAQPEDAADIRRLGAWWFCAWDVKRTLLSLLQPGRIDRELSLAELAGSVRGLFRYQRARRAAIAIDPAAAADVAGGAQHRSSAKALAERPASPASPERTAIVCIDLARPLAAIADAERYRRVRALITWSGEPIATATIDNRYAPIGVARLRDEISATVGGSIIDRRGVAQATMWCEIISSLRRHFAASARETWQPLRSDAAVSVVLPTRNRPDDLECCLAALSVQQTRRRVEIVVVDNDPDSGLTPPVVARFPGVRLVRERRAGLSYARNAGILAATGEIIVATDDDVTMPQQWLERLVAPFRDDNVAVVTGNVQPAALETPSQHLFESYGGLGRGFAPKRVDAEWFWQFRGAVPTWDLGATANAAFRASIFRHERIGLFDEALGAGMPTGCSEDTYVFYKALKAGYAIVYEPAAFVWHRHRSDMRSLRRQIYSYAKGHAAYHLTTLTRDGDWRALARLLIYLPLTYYRRTKERLARRSDYALPLILLEILGTLAGPFALIRARRIVRRLGPTLAASSPEHDADAVHVESPLAENSAGQLVVALPAEPSRM
jgi:GT2 family glycosyltransferase